MPQSTVPSSPSDASSLLKEIQLKLIEDKGFLEAGLSSSLKEYQKKYDVAGTSEERLKELNWEVVEYWEVNLVNSSNKVNISISFSIVQILYLLNHLYIFQFKNLRIYILNF